MKQGIYAAAVSRIERSFSTLMTTGKELDENDKKIVKIPTRSIIDFAHGKEIILRRYWLPALFRGMIPSQKIKNVKIKRIPAFEQPTWPAAGLPVKLSQ